MRKRQGIIILWLLAGLFCQAQTLRLDSQGQWQRLDGDPQGSSVLALSEIKEKIGSGDKKQALKALGQLREQFPELAGPDMEAYIEAETLFAKRNWSKSTKKFQEFIKTWPESPFFDIAVERLYSIGSAYLQGQKRQILWVLWIPAFENGADIMRNIADRMGTGPMGLRSLVTLAGAYEKKKKYLEAYEAWSEIADKWPTGEIGQQALLRMAQSLHAAYQGPQYDPTWLASSRVYYQDYIARFPADANRIEASDTVATITEQQAYKNYSVGQYYSKTDNTFGANLYYQSVVDSWPDSQAAISAEKVQSAGYEHKRTVPRSLFKAANAVFDSWFGLALLFGEGSES